MLLMRFEQSKDRALQANLETSSKHGILLQFKACSGERIAVLSNTIASNIFQYTSYDLY